jgi:RimJ/RimL family protein N-acetyltransferase
MNPSSLQGKSVRLSIEEPQYFAEAFVHWNQDSGYYRLLDTDPPRLWSVKKIKGWIEKESEPGMPENIQFGIRTIEGDKLIGFIGFDGINWVDHNCYVAIGIGDREYWGKGFGTDAMRLIIRYGFTQLNLHRISLTVFAYNSRAIRSYEKCGFRHEGSIRDFILRDGKRYEMLHMGILRRDWEALELHDHEVVF